MCEGHAFAAICSDLLSLKRPGSKPPILREDVSPVTSLWIDLTREHGHGSVHGRAQHEKRSSDRQRRAETEVSTRFRLIFTSGDSALLTECDVCRFLFSRNYAVLLKYVNFVLMIVLTRPCVTSGMIVGYASFEE